MRLPQLRRMFALIILFTAYSYLLLSQSPAQTPSNAEGQSMTPLERHIHSVCQKVQDGHKTTDKLTKEDLADLPVGIARQIGNSVYVVAIDSAYWDGKGWFFTAYASIKLPGSSRPIAFRASKVGFNKGGLTFSETKMVLAAPQYIALSDQLALELPSDGSNYLEFDCKGFKSVNLKGNFSFTNSSIIPDKDKTTDKKVYASVEINTTDLSNIIASVKMTPFKIAGIDDVSFEVKNATVDLSDYRNPSGFAFPADYLQQLGDSPNLWRGFYLEELTVNVKGFANEPTAIQAKQLLIDDAGVSGRVSASNILSIDKGSADGWPVSVKEISLSFLRNKLKGGTLSGELIVPFLGKDPLLYTAEVQQVEKELNYKFLVATTTDKEYSAPLSASIKLKQGSTITLEKKNGELLPSALLHGTISVKNDKLESSGIEFQNLNLISRKPYVKGGEFSTVSSGESKTMGFPVRIDNLSLKIMEGQVALGFGVGLNFMGADAKGFSAKTSIAVFAKLDDTQNSSEAEDAFIPKKQEWKYDHTKINDIELSCNTTALTLNGRLSILDNDPEFGNGFHGSLSLSVKNVLERGVQVNGYFGSKEGFRYWHLDAYAPTGMIPIAPSLFINGIIGGASYKMVRKETFKPDFTKLNTEVQGDAPPAENTNRSSGVSFTPDKTAGYSFMAGVTLIAGNEKAFNSDAVLEIALNESGGFRYVNFKGTGYFFTSVKTRGRSTGPGTVKAPVFADLNMMYDHNNNVFHANLKTYMNLEGTIRGTGPENLMGEAVMHWDSKDWYIYIGRSSAMLGVDIAHLAVAQGYFMAGTQIEGLPLPPAELREIMGQRNPDLVRDENALAMGRGFATGVRFEAGFDSKDKLRPFYAELKIGAGADMMIRDFGNTTCANATGKIGFDGWYASGQAYVFMKGKVGVKVKGHKFDFLNLGAAALLQAKLPNPSWLKGELAGKYSVLGGWVSGKFNVKVVVGEECEMITPGSGTELGEVLVIADIQPTDNSNDVSVFASPQVSFNTAIDTELSMLSNQDELNSYRIKLDEFSISNNGQVISTTMEWNGKKDVLSLRTSETLPARAKLKAFVKIHWEKKSGGLWEPLLTNNVVSYETKEANFTTGDAPNFIPEENITFSYPVNRQYNLLPKETNLGYIKLKMGQAYLFAASDEKSKWTYLARFSETSGAVLETPLSYSEGESTVRFDLPQALKNQTVYSLSFIKRPESAGIVDANVKRESINKNAGADNEVTIATTTLTGTATQKIEKEIYSSAFRTSKFNTFEAKWNSLSRDENLFDVAIGNIAVIGKSGNLQETFDEFEINGYPNRNKAMVQVIASQDNTWLRTSMGPTLYNSYPIDPSVTITRRDPTVLGLAPLKAVRLTNLQENYTLSDANISSGISAAKNGDIKLMYYLSYTSFQDFNELRNKAALLATSGNQNQAVQKLLSVTGYTDLMSGSYPVTVQYVLPGTGQVTSQKQIVIQF